MPPAYVRLANRDDEQFFRGKHATGQPFSLPPGTDTIVPWETACFLCGDPARRDLSPREPYRTQELHRLSVFYGCSQIGIDEITDYFPKLVVLDAEGEEVPMIMHDPKGLRAPYAGDAPTSGHEIDALRAQVAEMAKNQTMLMTLLDQREQAEMAAKMSPGGEARDGSPSGGQPVSELPGPDDEVTFDSPRRVKSR